MIARRKLSGTGTVVFYPAARSSMVTGDGTAFTKECQLGQTVYLGDEHPLTVTQINDDRQMFVRSEKELSWIGSNMPMFAEESPRTEYQGIKLPTLIEGQEAWLISNGERIVGKIDSFEYPYRDQYTYNDPTERGACPMPTSEPIKFRVDLTKYDLRLEDWKENESVFVVIERVTSSVG